MRALVWHHANRDGWVRLCGWGVSWQDHRVHPPLFSEREGYVRALHIGPWCLQWLRRRS